MRPSSAFLFVVSITCLSSGCAGGVSPSAPSNVTPPAPVPAPGPVSTNAVLEVSGFRVTVLPDPPGGFYFQERFTLTETGGRSGATIQDIESSVNGTVTDSTGPSCWVEPIRVAPGSTLDAFDAGWDSLLYCAPFSYGRTVTAGVAIVVNYIDDEGNRGRVSAARTVSR
jgi:hypothetical protein